MEHKNLKNTKISCKYDPDAYLIEESGTLVCSECGLVVDEQIISTEAEWRTFGNDSYAERCQKSRVGQVENQFMSDDYNLGTSISMTNSKSSYVSSYGSHVIKNLQRRSLDRATLNAFNVIDEMAARIHLPESVNHRAKFMYNKWYRNHLKGNINIVNANMGASLYIACHLEQCPRTIREISAITEVSSGQISKAQKRICKYLKIQLDPMNSTAMIPRACSNLGLPQNIQQEAFAISTQLCGQNYQDFLPETLVGTSIYLAGLKNSYKYRQADIGDVLQIKAKTICKSVNYVKGQLHQTQ